MTVNYRLRMASLVAAVVSLGGLVTSGTLSAQSESGPAVGEVTFTKDIAPILQRKCQNCHRPDSVAPMALLTYEDARPWARSMKLRTGLGTKRGAMPPWGIEKNIGIQRFKNDRSLSEAEIATIAKWADSGAPRGNPADMPPPLTFAAANTWTIGTPDLVVRSDDIIVPAVAGDRWGPIGTVPTGLTEDRWVSAVEVREVNDVPKGGASKTSVGGRNVFHHLTYSAIVPGADEEELTPWPTHEVGKNADIFPPEAGRLMKANSILDLRAAHIHANGRETTAHLELGFKFFPKGYKPLYRQARVNLDNTMDMDVQPNTANQELHAYTVLQQHTKMITFEPHMHATGVRMCLEAIWGSNIQQLSCASYDHNWVTTYNYEDDAAPLLPKGTILHLIGWLDTTSANRNLADNRNWVGSGRRSVASMFININNSVALTDEQFLAEMAKRRQNLKGNNDWDLGCPLCQAPPVQAQALLQSQQARQGK
jgi:mono/diheme cytochrome c family protein